MPVTAIRACLQVLWTYQCWPAQIYQYKKIHVPLAIYQYLGIITDPQNCYDLAVLLHQRYL